MDYPLIIYRYLWLSIRYETASMWVWRLPPFFLFLLETWFISRLRPCRWPLWQLRAPWLPAWWLGNILIGLLACWLVGFLLAVFCFASCLCCNVCWLASFWMLVLMASFGHLLLFRYRYSPLQLRTALRLKVLICSMAYCGVVFFVVRFLFL